MGNNSLLDVHITNHLERNNENHPVGQANEANEANETNETNRERIFEGTNNIRWDVNNQNNLYFIIFYTTKNAFRDLWHPDTVKFYEFYLSYSNSNRSQQFIGYVKKNKINILRLITLNLITLLISIYNNNWIIPLVNFIGHIFFMIYETKEKLIYVFDKNQYPPEIKEHLS
ncbi:hypothetical protein C1646_768581 [Rhizophagus diaphanus]|nr:hypothetical protein C1646_768581 [Rhizophagus diaphanus] [Rhizophagus sp. MUCL 43196]